MAVTRRGRALFVLLAVAVVAAAVLVGVRALIGPAKDAFTPDACDVGQYEIDSAQASVAATMIGAVTSYKTPLPTRAQLLVLEAALQESKLRNIPPGQGDRDSVGVLQQRPSQGWGGGKAENLTDVARATREFLKALLKVDGWQTMPAADAIQAVQVSVDGTLYAQHEAEASALAAALSGRTPAGVTCSFDKPTKVATTATVATQASKELGIDTPTAVNAGTVRVPGAHWQTAAWFVCNADRLGIDKVAYAGREWTRENGWARSTASTAAVTATMAKV